MKKYYRRLSATEFATALIAAYEEYETVRYFKDHLASLAGRDYIKQAFFWELLEALHEKGYAIFNEGESYVVFQYSTAVTRCTRGNYCARGRIMRTDSVERIQRLYVDPLN
ncbi:hypothetical protein KAR91_28095 [Candidatus Pacearchaeota archaeon]|nr:hypothetical protein [Candidatus Pacearchaeota archaeon]